MEKFGKQDRIEYSIDEEGILTLKVDTSKDIGPSASGKTIMIASSGGNSKLEIGDQPIYLGINIYKYPQT